MGFGGSFMYGWWYLLPGISLPLFLVDCSRAKREKAKTRKMNVFLRSHFECQTGVLKSPSRRKNELFIRIGLLFMKLLAAKVLSGPIPNRAPTRTDKQSM
jgi:hypothetical protein